MRRRHRSAAASDFRALQRCLSNTEMVVGRAGGCVAGAACKDVTDAEGDKDAGDSREDREDMDEDGE